MTELERLRNELDGLWNMVLSARAEVRRLVTSNQLWMEDAALRSQNTEFWRTKAIAAERKLRGAK